MTSPDDPTAIQLAQPAPPDLAVITPFARRGSVRYHSSRSVVRKRRRPSERSCGKNRTLVA
jgi:hypothetical protein